MDLTLVVGTGRCGSTLLSRILRAHPDILSTGPLFTALPPGDTGGETLWSFIAGELDSLGPVVRAWPVRSADAHQRALREHLIAVSGRTAIVERTGVPPHLVTALHRTFPDARFVHMVRDGPDCALSMSRHARALPAPAAGALWSSAILDGVAALDMLPSKINTMLRYEELLRSPEATLTGLAGYLGVPVDGDWLARARSLLDPSGIGASRTLPDDERAALDAACAPGMKALGLAG